MMAFCVATAKFPWFSAQSSRFNDGRLGSRAHGARDSRAISSEHLELWFHVGPPSLDLSAICEDLRTGGCLICELFISMVLTVLTQALVAV